MTLTLESFVSAGGLLGNLSYVLLIASMAMRDILWLRVLAISSGLTGAAYDAIWLNDPVGTFWEASFTLVNTTQWAWLVYERRRKQLTPEEAVLRDQAFPLLSNLDFRKLLEGARTETFEKGDTLLDEGCDVTRVYLLRRGEAAIIVGDVRVSRCFPGDFIGEIGFLRGTPATATVTALTVLKCLVFDADTVRTHMERDHEFERGVTVALNANLATKLIRANATGAAV